MTIYNDYMISVVKHYGDFEALCYETGQCAVASSVEEAIHILVSMLESSPMEELELAFIHQREYTEHTLSLPEGMMTALIKESRRRGLTLEDLIINAIRKGLRHANI